MFACRGCKARDQEIVHLLAQLQAQRTDGIRLTGQLCEAISPGSVARAAPKTPPTRPGAVLPRPQKPPVETFPGYERPDPPGPEIEVS